MRIFKTSFSAISLLCALGVSFLMGTAAQATPVFELSSTQDFRNNSWSFGEIFTVGGSDMNVTALGAYDAGGDGFVSSGGIPVGIFHESDDVLLTSSTVQSSDTLLDGFRYTNISPLTLLAGESYRVVAVNLNDLYNISINTFSVDPRVTRTGYGYCNTTALTSCDQFTGNETIWMANFQIDGDIVTPDIPAPAGLALFGLSLIGLGAIAGRRRKA